MRPSTAESASSRMRISALTNNARAMEIRCFARRKASHRARPPLYRNLAVDAKYRHVRWLTARHAQSLAGWHSGNPARCYSPRCQKKEWRLANYRRGYASYRVVTSSEEYHESEYPLADVEMTLNERQQGTFAGTSRPADTQHLTGSGRN